MLKLRWWSWSVLALVAVLPVAAQELRTGFEEDETAWSLGKEGCSSYATDQVHGGKRSLKIADPDAKLGSDVQSPKLEVPAGKELLLSVWMRLETGTPKGLGVYLACYGADGKRLSEPTEKTNAAMALTPGVWQRMLRTVTVPEEVKQVAVWLHTYSNSVMTVYVDDISLKVVDVGYLGEAAQWSGATLDDSQRKVWPYALRWNHGVSAGLSRKYPAPQDWSQYNALRFWVYSPKAGTSTAMLTIVSENAETEGGDYYSTKLTFNFEGWKEFVLPFRELGKARTPAGWQKIDAVTFNASGWNQTLNPETEVVIDGIELLKQTQAAGGQITSDEVFFASLNLELPALSAVKQAVAAGDYPAARAALAEHLRARATPKWFIDWRAAPLRGVKVPAPEEDKAPDQWDYYSTFVTVDWQGWKKITITKESVTPKAVVEGQGVKTKQPIGWHWIQYLAINAKGWNLTPNPETVLYFDDVRLVGRDQSKVISGFEDGLSNWSGLEPSTEQAHEGKVSGKWSNQELTTGIRCNDIPHDWTAYDALEMWVYSAKATGSKVVVVLDSDVPHEVAAAEKILQHQFDYTQGPGKTGTLDFGAKIDWHANPTSGEAQTHLWNESLNRHFHFRTLARAYWDTGRERYAKEIADQILDWAASNPRPMLSDGNNVGHYAWQTLTTSIRLTDTWPDALYRCLGSPSFTPEVLTTMLKSVREQALHLMQWKTSGNWLTSESNGLFTAGALFPEFQEAKGWRDEAIRRLYHQLDDEVYPDGMEYELAAGYNNWVVSEYAHVLEVADLCGVRVQIPADYLARTEKTYDYLLYASMPNGAIPGLNDSGNADVRGLLATGSKLFPNRPEFEYVATSRAGGKPPKTTSHAFPWSGHYVMRSGWDPDATYLLFDAGPFGYGHQHEDKLHLVLWAWGRQLLLDPGNFSYDRSRWRRYVLQTYGHNTVLVDGLDQNRRRLRETYFWPKPWTGAGPATQDARWASDDDYDYAYGVYDDGYGKDGAVRVRHERRVFYLKADQLFVVLDAMTPDTAAEHRYEALFHLDAAEATAADRGVVTTANQGSANLRILPAGQVEATIIKGKTDEPVQGWANGPWRAIPTAIYRWQGAGSSRRAFVLEPVAAGAKSKVAAVEVVPGVVDGTALRLTMTDGTARLIVQRDRPGPATKVAGVTVEKELAIVRLHADGKVQDSWQFDGAIPLMGAGR